MTSHPMRLLALLVWAMAAQALAGEAAERPTLAVLDPMVSDLPPSAVEAVGEAIRDTIVAAGKYRVQDRAAMREVLAQQRTNSSEVCDESCAVEQGRLLQVRYLVSATARKLEDTIRVSIRMTDVASGEVVGAQRGSCKCSLNDAVTLVEQLAGRVLAGERESGTRAVQPPAPAGNGVRLRFATEDHERAFTVSVRTEGSERSCGKPVKFLDPCVLAEVRPGPAQITVGGDAAFTADLAIPQSGRSVNIRAGWRTLWTGLAIFGGGSALAATGAIGMQFGLPGDAGYSMLTVAAVVGVVGLGVTGVGALIGGPELEDDTEAP